MGSSFPGYALPGTLEETLASIQHWYRDYRVRLDQRANEVVASSAAEIADIEYRGGTLKCSPFHDAMSDMEKRIKETEEKGWPNHEVDFGVEIVLFTHQGRTYAFFYVSQSDWRKDLIEHLGGVDYSFGTFERPKTITEREWGERRAVWEAIFANTSIPAQAGLASKADHKYPSVKLEKVVELQPSLEKRASNIAINRLIGKRIRELIREEGGNEDDADGRFDKAISALHWAKSDEAKVERDRMIVELMLQLKPLTAEDLNRKDLLT